MKNRYSDVSARPHSALVGSPFRNVVKRFDADIVRQHHVTSVSNARPTINDQPEPIFANILDRRGYDPSSFRATSGTSPRDDPSPASHRSPAISMLSAGRSSPNGAPDFFKSAAGSPGRAASLLRSTGPSSGGMDFSLGGGGGISGSSEVRSFGRNGSSSRKKRGGTSNSPRRNHNSKSPSSRPSSPGPAPSGGGMTGGVFQAHRSKVHALASRRSGGISNNSNHSSPRNPQQQGSPTSSAANNNRVTASVGDGALFRAPPVGRGGAGGGGGGGLSALAWGVAGGGGGGVSAGRGRSNSPLRPGSGGGGGYHRGGAGSPSGGGGRPAFGVAHNYQRWSNTTPNYGNGGDSFNLAMKGSQSYMDDAETVEVRREIQGAIEAFLYRPVARRFAEEASKWVEDHILPFAVAGTSGPFSPGSRDRPQSAGSHGSGGTDSSRSGPDGGGGGGANDVNIAARRQRTLELTEEVLPLLFHHIAHEIRDVVRLRIEAALLKRETRTSYL